MWICSSRRTRMTFVRKTSLGNIADCWDMGRTPFSREGTTIDSIRVHFFTASELLVDPGVFQYPGKYPGPSQVK